MLACVVSLCTHTQTTDSSVWILGFFHPSDTESERLSRVKKCTLVMYASGLCLIDKLRSSLSFFFCFLFCFLLLPLCQSKISIKLICPLFGFRNRTGIVTWVSNQLTWMWSRSRSKRSHKVVPIVYNNGCFDASISTDQRTKSTGKFEFWNNVTLLEYFFFFFRPRLFLY